MVLGVSGGGDGRMAEKLFGLLGLGVGLGIW